MFERERRPGPILSLIVQIPRWTPDAETWALMKAESTISQASVTIAGFRPESLGQAVSWGIVRIATSTEAVDAPLFYREVNLPFVEAVKDPSQIRWRFGPISSPGAAPDCAAKHACVR